MCEVMKTWVLGESVSSFEWLEEALGFKGEVSRVKVMGLHMGSYNFGLYPASAEKSLKNTVKGINFFRNHPCSSVAGE